MEDLAEQLVRWNLRPKALITHQFRLEDVDTACAQMACGHCGKAAAVFDGSENA